MERIKKWITVFLVLILTAGAAPPGTASAITAQEEEELAREFLKVALKQLDLIRDPEIVDYVNAVGRRIVSVLPPSPSPIVFMS